MTLNIQNSQLYREILTKKTPEQSKTNGFTFSGVMESSQVPFKGDYQALLLNRISFKGVQNEALKQLKASTENAYNNVLVHIKQGYPLSDADKGWVEDLQKNLGQTTIQTKDLDDITKDVTVDCRLTVESINNTEKGLEQLEDALKTLLEATNYKPQRKKLGKVELPIHNNVVANKLNGNYTATEFKSLFNFIESKGTFDVDINHETGFVSTCGVDKEKNAEMNRQWVTDTVRNGDIVKEKSPADWSKSMVTLAKFYNMPDEVKAFKKAIKDPESYTKGGPEEGIAHVFDPETLQRDPNWTNNKRLESHGLAFKAFCDTIMDGLGEDKPYGFKKEQIDDNVINSIVYLANFFKAIEYQKSASVGNWEEVPFYEGLTWDTEAIRSGFESLEKLLFDDKYDKDPEMQYIRERLVNSETALRAKLGKLGHKPVFTDEKAVEGLIEAGKKRVIKSRRQENQKQRPVDSSLVFITTSTINMAKNPENTIQDIKRHVDILKSLESIVRDNGMIRYKPFNFQLDNGKKVVSPDTYLNLNYNIALDNQGKVNLEWKKRVDKFGSRDASETSVLNARTTFATKNKEAEWFMVSDVSKGYGRQLSKLLDAIENGSVKNDKTTQLLLKELYQKETEYINRGYARITSETPCIKANGEPCPTYALPEAFQHVSTLESDGKNGKKTNCLPGWNTPLTWAKSSLYSASQQYLNNLNRLENMNLLNLVQ